MLSNAVLSLHVLEDIRVIFTENIDEHQCLLLCSLYKLMMFTVHNIVALENAYILMIFNCPLVATMYCICI